jgi:hypothetical protein
MEYSLTRPSTLVPWLKPGVLRNERVEFDSLDDLIAYLRKVGEVDGWILRIHHM